MGAQRKAMRTNCFAHSHCVTSTKFIITLNVILMEENSKMLRPDGKSVSKAGKRLYQLQCKTEINATRRMIKTKTKARWEMKKMAALLVMTSQIFIQTWISTS